MIAPSGKQITVDATDRLDAGPLHSCWRPSRQAGPSCCVPIAGAGAGFGGDERAPSPQRVITWGRGAARPSRPVQSESASAGHLTPEAPARGSRLNRYDEIRQADASNSSVSSRANIDIASGMSAADESARVDSITAMRSSNRRELSDRGRILPGNIDRTGGVGRTPDRVTTWRGRAVCDAFCAGLDPLCARPAPARLRRPPLPPPPAPAPASPRPLPARRCAGP